MTDQRMVDLDGLTPCRINANIVECLRIEQGEGVNYIALHTNQGFAVGIQPPTNKTVNDFYLECMNLLWPPEVTTTTTRERRRKTDG